MKRILVRISYHLKKLIEKRRISILENGGRIAFIRCRRRIKIY